MSYKTASKNKGKASYMEAVTIGKKAGGPKAFPYGKMVKLAGLNPKASVEIGNAKVNFTQPAPSHMQLHDHDFGVEFGGGPGVLEAEPLTQETELANLLAAGLDARMLRSFRVSLNAQTSIPCKRSAIKFRSSKKGSDQHNHIFMPDLLQLDI